MPHKTADTNDPTNQTTPAVTTDDLSARLTTTLKRPRKPDLIAALQEISKTDSTLLRRLSARFEIPFSPEELTFLTRRAIAEATAFDERWTNYNFPYDYEAYDEIRRNLARLVKLNRLPLAMRLAVELMDSASYQVAMSDEGLMSEDIEACLTVVIEAVKSAHLPPTEVLTWCKEMHAADCVGFLCHKELANLKDNFEKLT